MMLVEATEKYSEAENLKGNETDCQSPRKELKYSRALKQIIPIRPSPKHEKRNVLPTRYAGFISFFSVGWLTSMMWKAFKQKLDPKEIWSLPREEGSEENSKRLERLWCEEISKAKIDNRDPELWRAVWRFCRTRVIVNQILIIIIDVLFFSGSLLYTKKILEYIDDMTVDIRYGTMLIVGKLFLCTLFPIFLFSAAYLIGIHTSSRLTGALQALMYKKTLTLKTGGENLSAQVVNICSNDMERIFEASVSGTFLVDVPFTYSFCLMYSVYVFGPWSLVGFGIYFLFYPITGLIARWQSKIRQKVLRETDKRVALMSEILNSIRLIKIYAWEKPFAKKIAGIRNLEMMRLRCSGLLSSVTNTLAPSIGICATIVTLLCLTMYGNSITSADAFTLMSMFNMIGFTVSLLPYVVRCFAEAHISLKRIQKLLDMCEHHQTSASKDCAVFSVQIQDADYAWEVSEISYKDEKRTDDPKRTLNTMNSSKNKSKSFASNSPKQVRTLKLSASCNGISEFATDSTQKRDLSSGSSESATDENKTEATPNGISEFTVVNNKTRDTSGISESATDNGQRESSSDSVQTLSRISLTIPHGKLIGICGSIGSGKSSLISAICGDMRLERGKMYVNGKAALVTQQAWIYSGTLRENVLLGSDYLEERYLEALRLSCLDSDLELLPAGDLTEIGERGINLSGGQKQRVNLARAVYSDRDLYLLDDPLSAVDTKVGNAIFHDCIQGHLRNKTVLLVTHAIHLLEQCDEVIVMQDGGIVEQGSHNELLQQRGAYYAMIKGNGDNMGDKEKEGKKQKQTSTDGHKKEGQTKDQDAKEEAGKLTTEETKETGSVGSRVYFIFIKVCGGWFIASCLLVLVILFVLMRIFSNVWLQVWLDEGDGETEARLANATLYNLTLSEDELKGSIVENPLLWMYQTVYGTTFLALVIFGIGKGIGITFSVLNGASRLHNAMFTSILRSPTSFFDTTPTGRILNRFSRDLDEIDVRVPYYLEFVLQGILSVLGQAILVCIIYPWFTIPLATVTVLFVILDLFLNAGVRELKRIDSIRKSPVIQHIGSTLSGLSLIRVFNQQTLFTKRMYHYLDEHMAAQLVYRLSSRWYVFRTDMLSFAINVCITAICIYTKGVVSTATVGLALASMSSVCDFFPYLMKMKSEFQSRFTAVERLVEYSYDLESEAPLEDLGKSVPRDWPEFGKVEIKNVSLRYRPELPLVLHDIEATFNPGQKIGVVGRTGAGKSSLITTLLRLVETEKGSVIIDGVNVASIGLHTLRSAISVIPQDPILFQGSIRYNLDPFDEHSDMAVWEALEQSNLKKVVEQLELGLQAPVATAGENFSVGERQLICLTRALLRKSKILLLDEATASVDLETDQMIQKTIREAFIHSTVITIAHRLNTITNYDKILVLQDGKIVEFDAPDTLMEREGSLFREMMQAMGVSTVEKMNALT